MEEIGMVCPLTGEDCTEAFDPVYGSVYVFLIKIVYVLPGVKPLTVCGFDEIATSDTVPAPPSVDVILYVVVTIPTPAPLFSSVYEIRICPDAVFVTLTLVAANGIFGTVYPVTWAVDGIEALEPVYGSVYVF